MSRVLSAAATRAVNANESGEVFLILLTITHPDLTAPLRFVRNTQDITSRGDLYVRWTFDINLPDEHADQVSRVTLTLDNVDEEITQAIRAILEPIPVTMEVIMASAPDTVEAGPYDLTLLQTATDALEITGEIAFEDVLNQPFPADSYDPANYPGLF